MLGGGGDSSKESFSCRRERPMEENWSHKLMWAQSVEWQGPRHVI